MRALLVASLLATSTLLAAACGPGPTQGPTPPVNPTASASAAPPPDAGPPAPKSPVAIFKDCRDGKYDEVAAAANAVSEFAEKNGPPKDQALVDALWDCFAAYRPSATKIEAAGEIYRALFAVHDPSWGPKAVAMLARPITDRNDEKQRMDEVRWWQGRAVDMIGEVGYVDGIRPLVKALLTPSKGELVPSIRLSLARMPLESEPVLISALKGADTELKPIADAMPDRGFEPRLAFTLSLLGRPKGRDAVIEVMNKTPQAGNRTFMAMMLVMFPPTPPAMKAFRDAYAKTAADADLKAFGNSENARATMLRVSYGFFDPSVIPWILGEVSAAKGDAKAAMVAAGLGAAARLMSEKDAPAVAALADKLATDVDKKAFAAMRKELDSCKRNVVCHLDWLGKPIPTEPGEGFGHVKAVAMVAMLGDATSRAPLLQKWDVVKGDIFVSTTLSEALMHLTPEGDPAIGQKLIELSNRNGGNQQSDPFTHGVRLFARSVKE